MLNIIVKPTDPNASDYDSVLTVYELNIDGARKLVSPNLVEPITADDLPSEILGDDVFLRSAERQVLRDVGLTAVDVANLPRDSETFQTLLYLLQLKLAINISPKLPQLLRESFLSYAHDEQWEQIGWKERQSELQELYKAEVEVLNPNADVKTLPVSVLLTDSRLY